MSLLIVVAYSDGAPLLVHSAARLARFIGLLAFVLCTAAFVGEAGAQSAAAPQRARIQGKVVSVNPSQLVVHTSAGNQVVTIDSQTTVSPHAINLTSLAAGASVTVQAETTPDNRLRALQVRLPVSGLTSAPSSAAETSDLSIASIGASQPIDAPAPGVPWAWGVNGYLGILGTGNTSDAPTPIALTGLSSIVSVAPGWTHTLALTRDGTVLAWGDNTLGELGVSTPACTTPWATVQPCSLTPVQVPGLTDVVQIATGGTSHSVALRKDGTVWVWGDNPSINGDSGMLGVPAVNTCGPVGFREWCTPQPTRVAELSGIIEIASGEGTQFALQSDGTVMAWGTDFDHQLGTSAPDSCVWGIACSLHPIRVPGLTDVKSIVSGMDHAFAMKSDGTVMAWGWDGDGETGQHPSSICDYGDPCTPSPVAVPGLDNVLAMSGGYFHSLALLRDGTVWGFGDNELGALGLDPTTTASHACNWGNCSFEPVQVHGLPPIAGIVAADFYSLAVDQSGVVWNWGDDWRGLLGTGGSTLSTCYGYNCSWTPVRPLVPGGMTAIFGSPLADASFALNRPFDDVLEATDSVADAFGSSLLGQIVADPVNSFTGSLTLQQTDVKAPARGLPLSFGRTYNGRDPVGGVLGKGWSTDLDWRVHDRGNGQVAVTRADGRRDVYRLQPNGTYRSPVGVFDTLSRTTSGWTLQTHDQVRLDFAASGPLLRSTDRAGNSLVYTRDSNGHATQLADTTGRGLSFTYGAGGHLAQISDPAGHIVSYQYNSDGHLASVTNPSGETTHYAYGSNGFLSTVTDASGTVTLNNAYDSQGRVRHQADGTGATTYFAYDDSSHTTRITDPLGHASTVLHDAAGHVLSLTDADGKTVTYTYDADGNRTAYTDRNGNWWQFSYDANGNRTGVVDPTGGRAQFTYDTQNNLSSRTDPLGHTWHYTYDARGIATSVTDPNSAATLLASDAFGEPTRITDADGVVRTLTYDTAGDLISISDPAGTTQSVFDGAGHPIRVTDPDGHATTVSYDANGRPTTLTDPAGGVTHLDYDAVGNLVTLVDAVGATSQFHYDPRGRVVEVVDPAGRATQIQYDANGNRVSLSDAAGHSTYFAYDAEDRLVQITDALAGVTQLAHDPNGNLTRATDARGNTASFTYDFRNLRTSAIDRTGARTTYGYDAAGRLTSLTDPLGATITYSYDAVDRLIATINAGGAHTQQAFTSAGRLASSTDPNGGKTSCTYDAAGRRTSIIDATGGTLSLGYDAAGNVVSRTDPLGHSTAYRYDELNRLQQVVDALGGVAQLSYDPLGRVVQTTDPNGHSSHYAYAVLGRLISVSDALGAVTKYRYDALGDLSSVTDANSHTRQYTYDGLGRLISSTDALGRAQQFAYDANGNRTGLLDAGGKSIAFAYDAEDRLLSIAYPDGQHVQYTHDVAGHRTSLADSLGTTSFQYDAVGQLTRVVDPFGEVVQYAYDPNGNRTSLTYPDNSQVRYAYDSLNRLNQVTEPQGGLDRYSFDAAGNATGLQLSNGTRWDATYDPLNRLLSKSTRDAHAQVQSSFNYTYDAKGNVLSESDGRARFGDDHRAAPAQLTYTYDALDRLVGVAGGEIQTQYRYDPVGNRLDVSTLLGEHSEPSNRDDQARDPQAQYDVANQLTAIVGPDGRPLVTYSYDANGNLLSRSGLLDPVSYTWDAANRLTSVTSADALKTSYRYDGDGNLYQQQTTFGLGKRRDRADPNDRRTSDTVTYTLDHSGALTQILGASNGDGSAAFGSPRRNIWSADRLLRQRRARRRPYPQQRPRRSDRHSRVRSLRRPTAGW